MASWLVFLKSTSEEFVLPVMAPDREAALKAANSAYSPHAYTTLTCYAEDEMQQILREAQSWSAAKRLPLKTKDKVLAAVTLPTIDPAVSLAESKAAAAMARMQCKREEQMFSQPMLPEAPQMAAPASVPVTAALTSVRKQQTDKARQQVAATPVAAQPIEMAKPPVPQDLKTVLALLKATASTPTASATPDLQGRVEESQGTPLPAPSVATVPAPAALESSAISRRPQASMHQVPPAGRTVVDVFKGLRK